MTDEDMIALVQEYLAGVDSEDIDCVLSTLNGSGLCAGSSITFADVVLAEALSAYKDWCPDILRGTPLLDALHERILSEPGIAHYLQSAQRYPMTGDDYVIDVARVLQRALPSHMPDPNRFVP